MECELNFYKLDNPLISFFKFLNFLKIKIKINYGRKGKLGQ